jgi:cell division transport system permease protein
MFLLSFGRIIKFSFQDIFRNIWLSIVTVTILVLALFSINMLLVVQVISQASIGAVKDKIDVSIYVKPDAPEEEILNLKNKIESISEVKSVSYVSKAEALESFRLRNEDNPELMQALKEIGKNPLSPSFTIKPKDVETSQQLINELNKLDNTIIESKNFSDHKILLEKINAITKKVNEAGMAVSAIFIFITVLVIFNAVRVGIYTHRKEIGIMRLVGASNFFIHMPFVFSSLIFSFIGVCLIVAIFYPFLTLLQPYIEAFFVNYNVNIITYYNSHFFQIFGAQLFGSALVNVIASYIAIRKYAKV